MLILALTMAHGAVSSATPVWEDSLGGFKAELSPVVGS